MPLSGPLPDVVTAGGCRTGDGSCTHDRRLSRPRLGRPPRRRNRTSLRSSSSRHSCQIGRRLQPLLADTVISLPSPSNHTSICWSRERGLITVPHPYTASRPSADSQNRSWWAYDGTALYSCRTASSGERSATCSAGGSGAARSGTAGSQLRATQGHVPEATPPGEYGHCPQAAPQGHPGEGLRVTRPPARRSTGALQMAPFPPGHRSRPVPHPRAVRWHGHGHGCAGGWFRPSRGP